MPEVLDAPAAPTIVAPPAKVSAPPAAPGMISGRATPPPPGADKAAPPKKGTAVSEGFDVLDRIAGKEKKPEPDKPKAPNEQPDGKTLEDKQSEGANSELDDTTEGAGNDDPKSKLDDDLPPDTKTDATEKKPDGKKPNPWRLADEWKKKAQEAIRERDELKAKPPEDPEKETLKQRIATMEKESKALVDELKFYNYEKHDTDFKTQFDQPYIDQWQASAEEIAQFPVVLEDGTTRAGTAADLLRLVDLPPVQARELAEQMFGKYADDVLMERKRVREKFDARTKALDVARKGLNQRQQERQQQMEAAQTALKSEVTKLWEDSNKFATEHPQYGEYFRPIEGDQEGNLRLAKGREMAERAFNEDPNDPKLTPQQRADVVKRHALIFHRAAAFGRTVGQLKAARAKLSAIEKELAEYKSSTPGEGEGRKSADGKPEEPKGMAGAFSELDRMAR